MDMLTVQDVADLLRVSTSLVYNLVASGKIPSHRIGTGRGAIRVRRDDLEQYVRQCRVEPVAPAVRTPRPQLKHLRLK